jgi:hypothetical protein
MRTVFRSFSYIYKVTKFYTVKYSVYPTVFLRLIPFLLVICIVTPGAHVIFSYQLVVWLTFRVRHLNAVFVLRVRNFSRDSPLNRCACLTINVYKLCTEGDEIMQ